MSDMEREKYKKYNKYASWPRSRQQMDDARRVLVSHVYFTMQMKRAR
jgi:hypothetical protein